MEHYTQPPAERAWLHSGLLIVSGAGSKALLQGQLTCDLDALSPAEPSHGAHCNRAGKIISLFTLSGGDECFYLNMPRTLVPIAERALQKYAALYRTVTLTDASETVTKVAPALDTLRAGIPALYPETSEKFFVHELNLPALGAVSFDKGCYTGQEIIARMHYRGKPKTELLHLTVKAPQPPVRGSDVFLTKGVCGSIVDCTEATAGHFELLVTAPIACQDSLFMDEAHTYPLERV